MKTSAQISLHVSYIRRMSSLTHKVNSELINTDQTGNNHINDTDLKNYGTSIIDIGRRASALYKNMCTKEESNDSAHIGMLYPRQAAPKGKDYRRQRAIGIEQRDHPSIDYDCKNLIKEVTRHKDYPTAENHDINKKATRRVNWKGRRSPSSPPQSTATTYPTQMSI